MEYLYETRYISQKLLTEIKIEIFTQVYIRGCNTFYYFANIFSTANVISITSMIKIFILLFQNPISLNSVI